MDYGMTEGAKEMKFDPIKLELYRNILNSIAEEMGVALCRSALSTNIKERRDFSCAIFNRHGKMIAQAAHIPVHLGSMPLSVLSVIEGLGMSKGDMVILNDPFRGGTHLPDITLVAPVFIEEETPIFFVANRAHHADVGGITPGSMPLSTHIIQEGIRIPPIKIVGNDEIRGDVFGLLLSNVRTPEERRGDLESQISTNRIGKQRLIETSEKYGITEVSDYMNQLQEYSARVMRQILCHLPDGSYTFSDFLDDDGIDNHPIELCVKITIDGTEAIIDFTGSADQVKGSMNATYAITVSAVFYVFQCLACGDIPSNSGCLDPIEIIAPAGSIVNAQFPAAVAGGNVETSQRIVDVLLGALAKACPDRIPAASSGTMNNLTIGNQNYTYYETIGGGMGANPNRDGISAIQTHMTNTLNTPIESIETSYPLQVEKYRIRSNSGGAGRFRGGDGIVRSFRLLLPAQVTILSERRKFAPYGLDGGESGETGRNTLKRNNQDIELDGKVSFTGDNEDVIEIRTLGGGGFDALK